MGAGRDAMQDVEIVDDLVLEDAPGPSHDLPGPGRRAGTRAGPSPRSGAPSGSPTGTRAADASRADADADVSPGDDAAEAHDPDAARRRRAAALRRTWHRWWPVPVALVLAVVAVQVATDARERDRVAAVQALPGVLHAVDRDLTVQESSAGDPPSTWTPPVEVAGLRITVGATGAGQHRTVHATSAVTGDEVWATSLESEDPVSENLVVIGSDGTTVDAAQDAYDPPQCAAADAGTGPLLCLVRDQASVQQDGGRSLLAPTAAHLVTIDATDGSVTDRRAVEPFTGAAVDGGVLYLASLTDDGLRVTAGRAGTGQQVWRADAALDPALWAGDDLGYPPTVAVDHGHVLVQSMMTAWAFDADDGTLQHTGTWGLAVTRTGLLAESMSATRIFADDGEVLYSDSAALVALAVDDGSVPDLELLLRQDGSTTGALEAVDPRTGRTAWTAERTGWSGAPMILLDGVLYGGGYRTVWALDAATGRELWSTGRELAAGGNVLTDGRYLLALEPDPDRTEIAASARERDGSTDDLVAGGGDQVLVAYRLTDGSRAWTTPVPTDVVSVWEVDGGLVAYRDDSSVVAFEHGS